MVYLTPEERDQIFRYTSSMPNKDASGYLIEYDGSKAVVVLEGIHGFFQVPDFQVTKE